MVTLYDPRGNKIDLGQLKEEQSAPSLRSVRQVFSSSPSRGLTPQHLANILLQADQGNPHAQCELFEDMEEKDLHLSSIMGTRKRAVTGLEIKIEAPDGANAKEKKATNLLKEHIGNIPDLPEKLEDVLDAIGKGYSATEIIWGIHKQEAIIEDLRWREPKWFRFDQESMSELRMLDPAYPDGQTLIPYKYITHIHKAKSGLAVRGGILRPCAWMFLFKNYSFKDWVTFAEIYAQPLRVGKYPTSASEQEKDILLQAVANMGTDAAAIIPDSMLIEFVEASGKQGSTDLYERMCRFCDEQMSKGVLGQTSSADAMSGGLGSGQADLHGDVRDDLLRSDARLLSGTLNRDLVRPIIDLNLGTMDRYPKLTIFIEDAEDLKELGDNVEKLHNIGLPIGEDFLYQKFNIPKPTTGEAILASSSSTAPPSFPSSSLNASIGDPQAANAQAVSEPVKNHPSDSIAVNMALPADAAIGEWLSQIEVMLQQADDLDQFKEMIMAAFGDLNDTALANAIAMGQQIAHAAGCFDIENANG